MKYMVIVKFPRLTFILEIIRNNQQNGLKLRFLGFIDDAYKLGNENVIFFPNQRYGGKSVAQLFLYFMSEDSNFFYSVLSFTSTDSNSKMEITANIN